MSAGALGSPQLLMLSGIGPRDQLRAHNIPVVLDQPLVGQGMKDNSMNAVFVPSPSPVEISLIQVVGITHLGTYIEGASGANFAARDNSLFSPKVCTFDPYLFPVPYYRYRPLEISQNYLLFRSILPEFWSSKLMSYRLYRLDSSPRFHPSRGRRKPSRLSKT